MGGRMRTKMTTPSPPPPAFAWTDVHHYVTRTPVAFITVHSVLRAFLSSFFLHSVKSGLFYIQQIKLMYIYLAK